MISESSPESPVTHSARGLEEVGEMLRPAVNATDTRTWRRRPSVIDQTPGSNPGVPTTQTLANSNRL